MSRTTPVLRWLLSGLVMVTPASGAGGAASAKILRTETGLVLQWFADPGSYCFLQHSGDLVDWSWDSSFLHEGEGQSSEQALVAPQPGSPVFYRLVITDDYDSTPMQLDWAGDGFPVGWKLRYGLDPWEVLDPTFDLDGDGRTLLEEYQSGTHPLRRDHPEVGLVVMRVIL